MNGRTYYWKSRSFPSSSSRSLNIYNPSSYPKCRIALAPHPREEILRWYGRVGEGQRRREPFVIIITSYRFPANSWREFSFSLCAPSRVEVATDHPLSKPNHHRGSGYHKCTCALFVVAVCAVKRPILLCVRRCGSGDPRRPCKMSPKPLVFGFELEHVYIYVYKCTYIYIYIRYIYSELCTSRCVKLCCEK